MIYLFPNSCIYQKIIKNSAISLLKLIPIIWQQLVLKTKFANKILLSKMSFKELISVIGIIQN